jgi:hypothetical protein
MLYASTSCEYFSSFMGIGWKASYDLESSCFFDCVSILVWVIEKCFSLIGRSQSFLGAVLLDSNNFVIVRLGAIESGWGRHFDDRLEGVRRGLKETFLNISRSTVEIGADDMKSHSVEWWGTSSTTYVNEKYLVRDRPQICKGIPVDFKMFIASICNQFSYIKTVCLVKG